MLSRSRRLLATVSIAALLGAAAPVTGPTKTFDFTTGSMPSDVTFSRTTQATYINASGVLTTAAIDAPRLDYDPSTLVAKGLLIEPAATNLVPNSMELNTGLSAAWQANVSGDTQTTSTFSGVSAPDGNTTLTRANLAASAGLHLLYYSGGVSVSGTNTFSCYFKVGTYSRVGFTVATAGLTDGGYATFNLATGAVASAVALGGGSGATASIVDAGNGWYRCSLTVTFPSTSTVYPSLLYPAADYTTAAWTPAGTETLYQWGAQLEAGSAVTSYIPTTSVAVTRAADQVDLTGLGITILQGTAKTVVSEFIPQAVTGAVDIPVSVFTDTSASDFGFLDKTTSRASTYNAATVLATSNAATAGIVNKVACTYDGTGRSICLNGGTVATDSGILPAVTRASVYNPAGGNRPMGGWQRKIDYYDTRKSNTDLQALTA